MGLVALSQALGFSWIPALWVLQSLTPFVLSASLPLAFAAAIARRVGMAVVNLGILTALLWLAAPVVFHEPPGSLPAGAPRVTIASANVYFRTDRPGEAVETLFALGADLVAMTEYSVQVEQAVEQAVERSHGRNPYPFVVSRSPGGRDGVALFSRYPIADAEVTPIGSSLAIDATIDLDGVQVRVVVVHPLPGTDGPALEQWGHDIPAIGRLTDPTDLDGLPVVIVGDFNATRWHPAFREVLGRGWRSAHEVLGRGWSRSWPAGRSWPALVRIDHALVSETVAVEDIVDVAIPGSDHIGFVVTVRVPEAGS